MEDTMDTDILIVSSGCSGLYCALHLPREKRITVITKADLESSDSYLAQGGICCLKDPADYDAFFEDTLKAGHYENDRESVDIMIRSSQDVIQDLIGLGVEFQREEDGSLAFTREGAHSDKRILFHEDITGQEITSKLLARAKERENITLLERTTLVDILVQDGECRGGVLRLADGSLEAVEAEYTVLATGGVGGLYRYSTNFRHLTGDGLAIALRHGVALQNPDYVQIHPTTLYSESTQDRRFLISESVRGEGAKLYNKNMERFVDELLPRDRVSQAIYAQMEKDGTDFVWEDLRPIPNIVEHGREMGYDVTTECIPVVPAQHYFMGGVKVDHNSRTSMPRLYAVGETACNGVHGKNRLASNSLLESLVFAKRAAGEMAAHPASRLSREELEKLADLSLYQDQEAYEEVCRQAVQKAIGQTKAQAI